MLAECSAYAAIQHMHTFLCLGGWQQVVNRQLSSSEVRQLMFQEQHLVAGFMYECCQRRWRDPPPHLVAPGAVADVVSSDEDENIDAAQAAAADVFLDDLLHDQ
jgi:hypothetical protein